MNEACSPRRPTTTAALATLAIGLCVGSTALAADDAAIVPFSAAAPGEPPAAWKFASLPNKVPTKFSIVEFGGARVLKVEADESYGNLVHAMHVQVSERSTLAWRWRVDKLIDEADIKTRGGDDSPAKLCVFFAFDAAKLSLGERTKLAIAHSTTGQDVPTETLCYVWDNKLPIDTGIPNAFTKRIRFIVLESGASKLAQWVPQRRNLVADYQRMFGDESEGKVPEVVGVAVSADADNTHGHGLAYFGDITLTP
ncbi:MAG: DUF3047 domain-containing protein [Burkholderiales bacterium]